ncbi:uncharacterized protein LY89DRAFT_464132 [Mollisia scopiformis]|uniref:Uncharacterized protein n=1 Tax=Mollisia scopiformis TaxID=149040 RepID=A0A194XIB2_MOLSC|nr:uncharacterized protein LY89DRAFT_464132 [Mollisia scopiformis]KUJ19871.1 hypothetical protein LY89DRAFT_464132 [Mollisia scopiformis]
MNSSAIIPVCRNVFRPNFPKPSRYLNHRHQSSLSQLEETIYKELVECQRKNQRWDQLHAKHTSDLTQALVHVLPVRCRPPKPPIKFRERNPGALIPQGYHQVYFNSLSSPARLLPDGTDDQHCPGHGFVQRLWAGGSLTWNPVRKWMLESENYSVLQEDVESVQVKGKEGEEKVFVTISRKAALHGAFGDRRNYAPDSPINLKTFQEGVRFDGGALGRLALEEKKILVFMRLKTKDQIKQSLETPARVIKPIHKPDYSLDVNLSAHLLFQFSAMTFNAHRIHLDRQYCREKEGHRNLLVHGPLTQILMLSVLRSQLDQEKKEMVLRFDYKNLAPLYADELMRICTRRHPDNPQKFDVWIEGKEGGYAVKATAEIGPELDHDPDPLLVAPKVLSRATRWKTILKRESGAPMVLSRSTRWKPILNRDSEPEKAPKFKDGKEHFSELLKVFQGKKSEETNVEPVPHSRPRRVRARRAVARERKNSRIAALFKDDDTTK